jgi:hypothetical protein
VRALLLIADIGGYTQFMKLHRLSLAHAQENTSRLLEALVDAAPRLELVNVEGDAAFLSVYEPRDDEVAPALAGVAATMHRAFHERRSRMAQNLCPCAACEQLDQLTVKFVAHVGDVAKQSVAGRTTLAGLDVILVHRMLKNSVPIREYVLVTEPVLARLPADVQQHASAVEEELEGIGKERLHYVPIEQIAGEAPLAPKVGPAGRVGMTLALTFRGLPRMVGLKKSGLEPAPRTP